ncbi:MAG: response regulator [Actinobacteria bacterium]|nr:response regulator [Actinomycetota bacterium]
MEPVVERAAVKVATWAIGAMSCAYLVAALGSGDHIWWIVFGELAGLAAVGFVQMWIGRVSLPLLWVLVVAAMTMSAHVMPDPHRTGAAMGVAAVSAVGWVLTARHRRKLALVAVLLLWAAQGLFPASRGWLMGYEAAIFMVMSIGLRSIGTAMRTSQDRYQRLFEQAPIALWQEDFSRVGRWLSGLRRDGVGDLRSYLEQHPDEIDRALALVEVTAVNPAAAALIEVDDAAGMLGHIDPSTYTDETRPAFLKQVMTVWEGKSEMTTELQGRTVTGRPIQAIMRWVAPPGPHGTADYGRVVVSIDDVSELKAAQQDLGDAHAALSAREQQLRTVVSGAPVILFATDAAGVYTLAEGSGLGHLGLVGDDVLGSSFFERNADHPEALADMRRALGGEETMSVMEWEGRIWEIRRKPTFDVGGAVVGVIGVATDVTERHEMERALEGARHRNRLIVSNVSDLLFILDQRGAIEFASASVEHTLGWPLDDIAGLTVPDLIHPDDTATVMAAAATTAPGESTPTVPFRLRKADGTWLAMEAKATNLLDESDLAGYVVTARDVSEQVEARKQLEEARDAAEAAARAKSELLANVSHEIRTPMNAILGMTDLALDTRVTKEQHEYLTTVRTSAESLLTIINDLLDLARVEAGRLTIEQVAFSVQSTLQDVIRTMGVRARQKGVGLAAHIDEGVPAWVLGDPGRLRQIVMNLVGNAVKFTDEGTVTVTAAPAEGSLLRFTVADTGIGIGPEHLEAVFKAFEQVDGSMARRHGGTGLGLAITSKLVEAMGGTIGVESELGQGSRFTFTADLPPTAALAAIGGAGMAGGPALVVGDRLAREGLMEMVSAAGYQAIGVATSAEAQTMAASLLSEGRRVGAVIVDTAEPDAEYCRRLVGSEVLAGTPVVSVVAAGRRGDGARFRAAGVRAYLTRPLGESDVRETLAAIASGSVGSDTLITRHWLRERRRPLQVLLADDSPTNRMLAVKILEKRGHHLVQVADGIAATQAVVDRDFDVVLMDVQMPGMDGLEATRIIRAWEHEAGADRVPIIALTAHAMESDRMRCLAAGMDGYLAKPFTADQLVGAVEAGAAVGPITVRADADRFGGFVEAYASLMDGLETAVANHQTREAAAVARRLAVGLGRLGIGEAASAASRLAETEAGDIDALEKGFNRLAATLEHVEPVLGASGDEPVSDAVGHNRM